WVGGEFQVQAMTDVARQVQLDPMFSSADGPQRLAMQRTGYQVVRIDASEDMPHPVHAAPHRTRRQFKRLGAQRSSAARYGRENAARALCLVHRHQPSPKRIAGRARPRDTNQLPLPIQRQLAAATRPMAENKTVLQKFRALAA